MSSREFIALGTSSQAPTRERSHSGYFLRWDEEAFLFDPGEGTQRQLTFADVSARSIGHVCITHFHGDHCLGLPGIIQRISLEGRPGPLHLYYPDAGEEYFERLRFATIYYSDVLVVAHPVPVGGVVEIHRTPTRALYAHGLEHSTPTIGFRLEEFPRRHLLPEKLWERGLAGPIVGELARSGSVQIGGRTVRVEEVSEMRPGHAFAFVMDTRACDGAVFLARHADLLVMEATYRAQERELAARYRHSTAEDAARTAAAAGARRLALTHFSQRYPDAEEHLAEARAIFPETLALHDLQHIIIR
jgi:ribonuclease Z